jgi:hypothetical protein
MRNAILRPTNAKAAWRRPHVQTHFVRYGKGIYQVHGGKPSEGRPAAGSVLHPSRPILDFRLAEKIGQ